MFLRSLEWLLAAIAAVGILTVGYVLVTEPMEARERLQMIASVPVLGTFIWACVGPPLQGRAMWVAAAIFAVTLVVLFSTMLAESQSPAAWVGLVSIANAGGLMLMRRTRTAQR
jgi:hypothetical protein